MVAGGMTCLSRRRQIRLKQLSRRWRLTETYDHLLSTDMTSSDTSNGSPLVLRPPAPPLPGSSMSILSSFGVLASSPSESLSPLARLERFGGWKFSTVRLSMSPPLAVNFSRISTGGGSRFQKVLISYALRRVSKSEAHNQAKLTPDSYSRLSSAQRRMRPHWRCPD